MHPFDQPPRGTPVSLDPPRVAQRDGHAGHDGPRRGRMALAALAAAGLVGGGVVVAGQFASADDRPSFDAAETVEPGPDAPAQDDPPAEPSGPPSIDGEIVIDDGTGDPLVLDIGGLAECLGPLLGSGPLFGSDGERMPSLPFDDEFAQRMEEFLDGSTWDEDGDLDDGVRIFGSGGSMITVVGPDGVEVIDLGEGDATVTIEQTDGELTIETDGDATVSDLPDFGELLPGLGTLDPGMLDFGDWQSLDELPSLGDIESCLDD